MITSYTFSSIENINGPKLLITGAIHGNEPCGTIAINKIIGEIESNVIQILKGSITFIPICNPEGFKQNKRFIDQNLARIFDIYPKPNNNEQKCSTIIAPYIDGCDVLMDIHSGDAKNSKFIFQDIENSALQDLTSNLGFDLIVHGWPDMYPNDGAKDPSSYAHNQGKTAIVIECGQHNDPQAENVAYNTIKNFLYYYGLIEQGGEKSDIINHVTMKSLVYMDKSKVGTFIKDRKNGDPINKGDLLAQYDDGSKVFSDTDGFIILPKHFATPGTEWFYLGVN